MGAYISVLVLALGMIGAVITLFTLSSEKTYGSSLEQYINDRNPQNGGDVERLTVEYNMKSKEGRI